MKKVLTKVVNWRPQQGAFNSNKSCAKLGLSCNCIVMYDNSISDTSCYICHRLTITHTMHIPQMASVLLSVLVLALISEAQLRATVASLGRFILLW